MTQQRRRSSAQPKPAKNTKAAQTGPDTTEGDEDEAEEGDDDQDTGEGDNQGTQGEPGTAEGEAGATGAAPSGQTPATEPPKPPAATPPAPKKHFDAGRASTKPEKPKATQRPYLETPRAFGLIMPDGILRRFAKGRTLLKDMPAEHVAFLRKDSYVADHGGEVVTDED